MGFAALRGPGRAGAFSRRRVQSRAVVPSPASESRSWIRLVDSSRVRVGLEAALGSELHSGALRRASELGIRAPAVRVGAQILYLESISGF